MNWNSYFTFIINALDGGSPVETDIYLKKNFQDILECAEELYSHFPAKTIYRGVILDKPAKYLRPHPNFTYISCSESYSVAEHFANPNPSGFGSIVNLGSYGYVVEIPPPYTILYHHAILSDKEFLHNIFLQSFTEGQISLLKKQKEVMILQPQQQIRITNKPIIKKNPKKVNQNDAKEIEEFILQAEDSTRELPKDIYSLGYLSYKTSYLIDREGIRGLIDSFETKQHIPTRNQMFNLINNIYIAFKLFLPPYLLGNRDDKSAYSKGVYQALRDKNIHAYESEAIKSTLATYIRLGEFVVTFFDIFGWMVIRANDKLEYQKNIDFKDFLTFYSKLKSKNKDQIKVPSMEQLKTKLVKLYKKIDKLMITNNFYVLPDVILPDMIIEMKRRAKINKEESFYDDYSYGEE